MLETTCRDVRYAFRQLKRRPGFAAVAVLTIAVGLGTMTVAFTAVDVFIVGSPQFELPGGGWVLVDDRGQTEGEASLREYEAFARDVPSLDVAASTIATFSHRGRGAAERIFGLAVSSNYFELQDIAAARGRTFRSDDRDLAVVVSDRFWRERLNEAALTGLALELNGLDVPVIGVLPEDHRRGTYDPSVWMRFEDVDALGLPAEGRGLDTARLSVIGRLKPGATAAQATSQLAAVSGELASAWPDTHGSRKASFVPFAEGTPELRAIGRAAITALSIIGIVLLIALFNLVGLLLARAVDRERELSLRGALGASRGRLVRQLVTESLVISSLGGALALAVARFSSVLLQSFAMQAPIPTRFDLDVNWAVVGFTTTLVVVCGVVAGLLPARRATRIAIASVMGPASVAGGGRSSKVRSLVVSLQLAGATMLLIVAALLVRSAVLSEGKRVGFEQERAVVIELFPANHGYAGESAQRFVADAVERFRALPGVVAAAAADRLPFYIGFKWQMEASIDGTACELQDCPTVAGYRIGPGYFRAMNIPLTRGREFDGSAADPESVVISATTAQRFWPSSDPLGQWVTLAAGRTRAQVIGVAADVLHRGLGERPEPYVYLPLDRDAFTAPVTIVVRTAADPRPLMPAVSEQVRTMDPSLPIWSLQTMDERLDMRARAGGRIVARFFLVCGGLGLFLALVGLTGSVSYAVRQRTRELGIRAAIGAAPGDLGRLVIGGALRTSGAGIAAGSAAALGLTTILRSRVSGLDLDSPMIFGLVALLLALVAVVAAAVPGYRASRVDPLLALRAE
jgi:predicted permease